MDSLALRELVANALAIRPEELTAESGLNRHPAWDSLAHVRVIVALESALGLTIDDATLQEYTSMATLLRLLPLSSEQQNSAGSTPPNQMTPTDVHFTSFDGLPLSGTLERPGGPTRGRALFVHGMTATRDEWGFFTQLAARLAGIGIASLRFDYRCHGAAATLPSQDLSLSGIANDIEAAHAALVAQIPGEGLPEFLVGVSFGGGVSASWARRTTARLSALFLCSPVLNYLADLDKTCGDWRAQLAATGFLAYADMQLSRAVANEASRFDAIAVLRGLTAPVLILHGDHDNDVPIEHSRYYATTQPQRVSLIEVPGADHGFVVPGDTDVVDPDSQKNYDFVFARILERCQEILRA